MLSEEYVETIYSNPKIKIIEPVSFLEMIKLESSAEIILTDSGGVQKEAFFLKKPCVILRSTTEWKEIVEEGNAAICDANYSLILEKTKHFLENPPTSYPPIFGDGQAAKFICEQILKI
jgi:UDP-GlcNAc3NAcA epimerase